VQVYIDALSSHDIVVGPLARADVAAVAQSGRVDKPTLVLANPDSTPDATALPPKMLPIGLSIEDEARQLATWAGAGRKSGKAFVVSTGSAWQRRTAHAFAAAWQRLGLEAQPVELASSGGYLHAAGLEQLKKRLQEEPPSHIFYALDALQAGQMQLALGRIKADIYGTSQINPHTISGWRAAERRPEMNGVHFVDMPWLLQGDHPAVMVYPRLVVAADQSANPDLERLYALGIDAFRIARELAAQRTAFELDGVTGQLKVHAGSNAQRFSRTVQRAWYQDGMAVPVRRNP
jgi:outer membrane PBP1 activator LpoA protein